MFSNATTCAPGNTVSMIQCHVKAGIDYSHSFDTLPVGCGAEIFTFEALERSYFLGRKANHREHVNEYIQENPYLFHIASLDVPSAKKRPDLRLTVDTDEDYRRACYIADRSNNEYVTTERAVALCLEFENRLPERDPTQQE
jgi:spore coat polysaccharide biosynthesis protein SpsF